VSCHPTFQTVVFAGIVEHTIRSGKRSRLGHAHGRVGIAGKGGGRVAGGAMLVAVDGPANQFLPILDGTKIDFFFFSDSCPSPLPNAKSPKKHNSPNHNEFATRLGRDKGKQEAKKKKKRNKRLP